MVREHSLDRRVIPAAPPLRVWILTLFLAVLGLSLLVFQEVREIRGTNTRYLKIHQQSIQAFGRRGRNSGSVRKVVMIGTSLLYRSVRTHNLAKMAKRLGKGRLRFLILARPQGNLTHFLPLMDRIRKLSPDLLLIESDLLFSIEYTDFFSRAFLRRLPGYVSRRVRGWFGSSSGRARKQRDPARYLKRRQRSIRRRMALPTIRPQRIRAVTERLHRAGIRVALLDIPRAFPLEVVKNRRRENCHREFLEFLRRRLHLPWLIYPRRLDSSFFRDYSHLTPAGGRLFLNWLLPEINELLKTEDPA